MRKSYLLIFSLIGIFCSCSNDNSPIDSTDTQEATFKGISLTNYETINSALFNTYSSKAEVMSDTTTSTRSSILSDASIETMQDVQDLLEEQYSDTVSSDDLIDQNIAAIAQEYSDILTLNPDSTYRIIINTPSIASKFNSKGVLEVNDTIYLVNNSHLYEYLDNGDSLNLIKSQKREITYDSNTSYTATKNSITLRSTTSTGVSFTESGEWECSHLTYRLAKRHKVEVWLYADDLGDLGTTMGGQSLFWKRRRVGKKWVHTKGDNSLKFTCSTFKYTNFSGNTVSLANVESKDNQGKKRYLHASETYASMDADESYTISSPVVTFYWSDSNYSANAYTFSDFED